MTLKRLLTVFRWLAVLPAAVAGMYAGVFLGIKLADGACAAGILLNLGADELSGVCFWHAQAVRTTLEIVTTGIGGGVASVCFISFGMLVAPAKNSRQLPLVLFLAGMLLLAGLFRPVLGKLNAELIIVLSTTLVCGFLCLRYWRKKARQGATYP